MKLTYRHRLKEEKTIDCKYITFNGEHLVIDGKLLCNPEYFKVIP